MSGLLSIIFVVYVLVSVKIYAMLLVFFGQCTSKKKLHGKTVIVTGGNSGIGFQTAKDLANRGARVIITSENEPDCIRAKNQIINETGNENIVAKYLDFTSLAGTRKFAADILKTEKRLDVLINNAGSVGHGNKLSADGILLGLQINYFGPFLLTHLLICLLKKTKGSRIVNVASHFSQISYYKGLKHINCCPGPIFSDTLLYNNSKLFVVYMTWEFASRLKDSGVTVNCLTPGYVNTAIIRKKKIAWSTIIVFLFSQRFFKTAEQGAQTSIHLAVSDDVEDISGKYFDACKPYRPYIKKDLKIIREVWNKSIDMVKLSPEEIQV